MVELKVKDHSTIRCKHEKSASYSVQANVRARTVLFYRLGDTHVVE